MPRLFLLLVCLSPAALAGSVTDALNSDRQGYGPLNSPVSSAPAPREPSRVTASIVTSTATASTSTDQHRSNTEQAPKTRQVASTIRFTQ